MIRATSGTTDAPTSVNAQTQRRVIKCPSVFNVPNKCKLEQKAGKCRLEPVCKFDGTYTLKKVDAICVHNNKHYRHGQMWSVGCEFECICEDAATGFYACQSKCFKYDSLPSNCKLMRHQGECCERPDCEFQIQVGKFTGTGGSRKPGRVSAENTTCVDKILDCDTYPADLCSSDTNRSFALDNCRKFCNLTWHDGCEKTCVCDDAESGYVRCEDRCPDYLNLPHGCSLVTVPGQCCRSLSCDTQATFTGSQLQHDTVGALPARVQPARADKYPTLPPGETYAPGQNSALLVEDITRKPAVTAQRTSPTPPSLNTSVSGDDGRVMTSKISELKNRRLGADNKP
ncbi:hypothetical protein RRG08_041360 [Elysia crispata]|uniref:VWFC domain-containing protein n=1 Tax=Elysia crispata TaxID=231223 RepID=A0AAE1BEL5_9GAST|nr:hypothetical protein RRG08_041360 [Elysia crispata]